MDSQNIITVTNNLDDLELDMNNWLHSLTFDQQKKADVECLAKYGCTNVELFNSIKATILKNSPEEKDTVYMNEAVHIYNDANFSDLGMETLFYKIKTSNFLQSNDENIVIINDFLSDAEPDYNLDQLVDKYNRYILLDPNYKGISNDYSIELWGRSVAEMFIYMKSKIQKKDIVNETATICINNTDKLLKTFETTFKSMKESNDILETTLLRIEALASSDVSLYEQTVLGGITESYIKLEDNNDYRSDVSLITPFFNFTEYCNIYENGLDINPFTYCIVEDGMMYRRNITLLQDAGQDTNADNIMKLGWNPYITFSPHNSKYAREKQINWLNENMKCKIINLTEYSTNLAEEILSADIEEEAKLLEPIYICLVHTGSLFGRVINKVKKSTYSHAGMSFNATLNTIYSFGIKSKSKENGLVVESLDDYNDRNRDSKLLVLALYVHPDIKKKVERNVMWYIDHKEETKYSIKNLFRILFNKATSGGYSLEMVCSQFVDTILKLSYVDITGKPSNLVAPCDLAVNKKGVNIFALYEGSKKDYDFKQVERKAKALKQNLNFSKLHVIEPKIVISKIKEARLIESFNVECTNPVINDLLKEVRRMVTPQPAIVTEAKAPIGFNKEGDLYVELPKDLQKQYEESHRLLYMYDVSNLNGIKKELAKLFYLNSIIEKKLKKCKDKDEKKELTDLRARILNDYKTYFKIVCSADPEFDFENYIRNTDYYDKTITVDNTTVKYTGSMIKSGVKALIRLIKK